MVVSWSAPVNRISSIKRMRMNKRMQGINRPWNMPGNKLKKIGKRGSK